MCNSDSFFAAPNPSTTEPNLGVDLLIFYDDFLEFQGCCTFLCDSFMSLSETDMNLDEACIRGVHIFSGQVKRTAETLKDRLKVLLEQSRASG
ncbi:MAG: hypothetical protein V4732_15395 [Pseudomonadota bacterium]